MVLREEVMLYDAWNVIQRMTPLKQRLMKLEERHIQMETRIDNVEESPSWKMSMILTNVADIPKKLTGSQKRQTRTWSGLVHFSRHRHSNWGSGASGCRAALAPPAGCYGRIAPRSGYL